MNMQKQLMMILALLGSYAATMPLGAAAKIVTVEQAIEASTDTVVLPASAQGTLDLTCPSCRTHSYRVTDTTGYFVGDTPVTLAQLKAFILGGHYFMTVFVKPGASVATRIVVSGQWNPKKRK